jgi:4-diphosphocytidyl-2-C-methyl-D-erythritol kinase
MNLAWQAAALLRDTYGVKRGVHIHITKRIPVGSGMGGGSSNAACVLMGLNRLWRLGRSREELADLGKKLGADVPFFIYDTAFARGKARGDEITPLRQLKGLCLWHILVVPRISVSTSLVYKKWDEWHHHFRTLTIWRPDVKISLLAKKKGLPLIRKALFNSLEAVSVRLYPQIRQIKTALLELGVQVVLMSGSGPAVFGLVSSRKEALSLRRQLKKKCSWQVYTVRTI